MDRCVRLWTVLGIAFSIQVALRLIAHPGLHPLFETLAYAAGFFVYRKSREKSGDSINDEQRWMVIAAAAIGAVLGSRLWGVLEQVPRLHQSLWRTMLMSGGKTIVGGLLGGWLVVEAVKKMIGVRSRTGDLFAIPLCVGIAVGRVGCFLAGLADDTYGKPTSLPWGVDFGDGVARHPTQLYEIVFLIILICALRWLNRMSSPDGTRFRVFLTAYLGFRLAIDFIKPQPLVWGMNLIQWACLAGMIVLTYSMLRTHVFAQRRIEEKGL